MNNDPNQPTNPFANGAPAPMPNPMANPVAAPNPMVNPVAAPNPMPTPGVAPVVPNPAMTQNSTSGPVMPNPMQKSPKISLIVLCALLIVSLIGNAILAVCYVQAQDKIATLEKNVFDSNSNSTSTSTGGTGGSDNTGTGNTDGGSVSDGESDGDGDLGDTYVYGNFIYNKLDGYYYKEDSSCLNVYNKYYLSCTYDIDSSYDSIMSNEVDYLISLIEENGGTIVDSQEINFENKRMYVIVSTDEADESFYYIISEVDVDDFILYIQGCSASFEIDEEVVNLAKKVVNSATYNGSFSAGTKSGSGFNINNLKTLNL